MIHRDLKLENVLFESKARVRIKVVDFGISGVCSEFSADKNNAATLRYMTPEMISQSYSTANSAMDVWAMGVMVYAMIFCQTPFDGDEKEEIRNKIMNQPHRFPKSIPVTNECRSFIDSCLKKDPVERISVRDMLFHDWMGLNEDVLDERCKELQENYRKKIEDEEKERNILQ